MKQFARSTLPVVLCLPLCGCLHAPSFSVLGSYFPAWMLCLFVGIAIAVLFGMLVNRLAWQDYVRPAVLTYPGLAALVTFALWLVFFD